MLSTKRKIGPGCIQRPPEAQYQDEFYCSCHACSNGSLIAFPEFGTGKGESISTYPLSNGVCTFCGKVIGLSSTPAGFHDQGRMEQIYRYQITLYSIAVARDLSIHVPVCVLSAHQLIPLFFKLTLSADIPNLYHVVFSNDYKDVSIVDHILRPVPGGDLRLLLSS
jgi:hypothetical protein